MSTPDPAVSVEKHGLEVRIAGGEVQDALNFQDVLRGLAGDAAHEPAQVSFVGQFAAVAHPPGEVYGVHGQSDGIVDDGIFRPPR